MGALGKDLLDIYRNCTHVKEQFGVMGYWVENKIGPLPYGAVLADLLDYDIELCLKSLSAFEETLRKGDLEQAEHDYHALGHAFSSLPFYRITFRNDIPRDNILAPGFSVVEKILALDDDAMNKYRWAAEDVVTVREQYL